MTTEMFSIITAGPAAAGAADAICSNGKEKCRKDGKGCYSISISMIGVSMTALRSNGRFRPEPKRSMKTFRCGGGSPRDEIWKNRRDMK